MPGMLRIALGVPFRGDTWRRVAYGLLALPIGLLCLLIALVGRPTAAARLQHRLAHRLGLPGYGSEPAPRSGWRGLGFGLLAVPLNAAAFALTAYTLTGLVLNLAYPIRWEDGADAWGGPTLAGAWAVHAVGGIVVFGLLGLWLIRAATWLCGKTTLCATGIRTRSSLSSAGSASSSR